MVTPYNFPKSTTIAGPPLYHWIFSEVWKITHFSEKRAWNSETIDCWGHSKKTSKYV